MVHGPWVEYGDMVVNLAQYERVFQHKTDIVMQRPDSKERTLKFETKGDASIALRAIKAVAAPLYLGEPDDGVVGR